MKLHMRCQVMTSMQAPPLLVVPRLLPLLSRFAALCIGGVAACQMQLSQHPSEAGCGTW